MFPDQNRVDERDYFLHFTLPPGLMPDPQFDNFRGKIQVHRVSPVYPNSKCDTVPNRAAVLVHGKSVAAQPTFDLRHPISDDNPLGNLSVQVDLARGGIDTFAANLLGYGPSQLEVMGDRILYYSVRRNFVLTGAIDPDNDLSDVPAGSVVAPINYNVAPDWTQITALSGGRILWYSPTRQLLLIGTIDTDNFTRDVKTFSVTDVLGESGSAHWTQITAVSRDRVLFYNADNGSGAIAHINGDNTFGKVSLFPENSFARDWTQITGLSANRILYYSAPRNLVLIGTIGNDDDVLEDTPNEYYNYEGDWTEITALSGNRILYYSADRACGRIEYIHPDSTLSPLTDTFCGFAPDWTEIASRWDEGLNDPGNASLTIPPDATHNTRAFNSNLQGLNGAAGGVNGLSTNPLRGQTRPHSSDYRFARTDVWVRDIRQVIEHAIAEAHPDDNKVALIGYSLGSPRAARTLLSTNPVLSQWTAADHVNKLVLIAPFPFGNPPNPNNDAVCQVANCGDLPPDTKFVSWSLDLQPENPFPKGMGVPPNAGCENDGYTYFGGDGMHIPGTEIQFAGQQRALETLGNQWGGADPNNPTGLIRVPTFSTSGFNQNDVGALATPTLVIGGQNDNNMQPLPGAPAGTDRSHIRVYDNLTMGNKVLVDIQCATHQLLAEICEGSRCAQDNWIPGDFPYGIAACRPNDPEPCWGGPHSAIITAVKEWINSGMFAGRSKGEFTINKNGLVRSGVIRVPPP